MKIYRVPLASVALLAGTLSGCQASSGGSAAYAPDAYYPTYYPSPAGQPPYMAGVEPAAGPQPLRHEAQAGYGAPAVSSQQVSALESAMVKLDDRLQRVEKAMLRLDRRMQLVERNELNRMTGAEGAPHSSLEDHGGIAPALSAGGYTDGFQPVSTAITSSLQAAARPSAGSGFHHVSMDAANARAAGMPSLADGDIDRRPSADGDLAIWTVKFQGSKVWPDRAQLPGSREVVSALRSGQPVTVFARGKQPNAVLFRDRVKAISRYLGKVSAQDSVPIAALPGSHLDSETIEIFATY